MIGGHLDRRALQHVGGILGALLGRQVAATVAAEVVVVEIDHRLDRLVGHPHIVGDTAGQLATQRHQTPLGQHGQVDILEWHPGQQILRGQVECGQIGGREHIHIDATRDQLGRARAHGDLGRGIPSSRRVGRQPVGKLGDGRWRGGGVRGPVEGVLLPGDVGGDHVLDVILVAGLIGRLGEEVGAGHHHLDQVPLGQRAIIAIEPDEAAGIHIIATVDRGERAVIALPVGVQRGVELIKAAATAIEVVLAATGAEGGLILDAAVEDAGLLGDLGAHAPVEQIAVGQDRLARQVGIDARAVTARAGDRGQILQHLLGVATVVGLVGDRLELHQLANGAILGGHRRQRFAGLLLAPFLIDLDGDDVRRHPRGIDHLGWLATGIEPAIQLVLGQ